jgi:hypothetical protein
MSCIDRRAFIMNIENTYKLSVAHNLGIGISNYTRSHASAIVELELRANAIENWLDKAIADLTLRLISKCSRNLVSALIVHQVCFEG